MRRNKRWMAWVAAGFLAVYTAAMGLSLCLSADRYRETFRMAYQTKEIQAREELRTLEQVLAEEPDADDAFRERFSLYLLGTFCAYGSRYQQISGAVYDAEGKKIAEAENGISIMYGYPYGGSRSQPASWPMRDYLTEEETEELAGYAALSVQSINESVEKMDAWEREGAPDFFEEYDASVYVDSKDREPYGIFVQKKRWERDGESVTDPLTGILGGTLIYGNHPDTVYGMTDGEIVWQWGESFDPESSGSIAGRLMIETMFPCISSGYDAWECWEQNEYLHGFPEELPEVSGEQSGDLGGVHTKDRWKRTIQPVEGSGYSMVLAYYSHPWLAAADHMKYAGLGCGIFMLACLWAVCTAVDRTYRKQEALEENRRDFTNAMAHELKTPLGIIRGFAENLLERVNEEKREYYLRQIIGQTEKMDDLAAEMLAISRMDSGKLILQKERVSMQELMREELEELQVMTEEQHIQVRCDVEEDLILQADREYLKKALRNLLTNAVMYNRMDGRIHIQIRAQSCAIENTGTPLSEEQLKHGFEMFDRGGAARNGTHAGLGLYLANRILTLQGLALHMENTADGVRAVICTDGRKQRGFLRQQAS